MIADYQTDKAEHLQDSASYHQPMRKLHLGEYLNLATSDRSSLWFRPIYPDLLESGWGSQESVREIVHFQGFGTAFVATNRFRSDRARRDRALAARYCPSAARLHSSRC